MPDYEITSPDGQKYRVTAPDGASQDEVLSYAKKNLPAAPQPQTKPQQKTPPAPSSADPNLAGDVSKFLGGPPPPPSAPGPPAARPRLSFEVPSRPSNDDGGVPKMDAENPDTATLSALTPEQKSRAAEAGVHTNLPGPSRQTLPGGRQILYDMASNDVERVRVLRKYYGEDSVGRDRDGIYVRLDNGKKVYPESSITSSIASQAAPTVGAMGGGLAGAALGSPSGPGAIASSAAGAGLGSAAGQGVNDAIMKAFGAYDRTPGEEAEGLAGAALGGAAGEGIGRAVAMAPGGASGLVRKGVRSYLDIDPKAMNEAADLARQGFRVAPSSYAKGAPRLQRSVDISRGLGYDPTAEGHGYMLIPGAKGSKQFVDEKSASALKSAGLSDEEAAAEIARLKETSRPSLEGAGEQLKAAAGSNHADAEKGLAESQQKALDEEVSAGKAEAGKAESDLSSARSRMSEVEGRLQKDLDVGFRDISKMQAGSRPGNLAKDFSEKLKSYRSDIQSKADTLYGAANFYGGSTPIRTADLKHAADDFVSQMPADLKGQFPILMRRISAMESGEMTFGELHQTRTLLRDMGYSDRLTPEFKKGPYRYLSGIVNDTIQQSGKSPELKQAVQTLNRADKFYSRNMAQFRNKTLQGIVNETLDKMYPDPKVISRLVIQPGEASTLKRVMKIGGDDLSKRIRNADLGEMMSASRSVLSDKTDPELFWKEVDARRGNGTLSALYGDDAGRIVTLAKRLAAKAGKIPIDTLLGESGASDNFVRNLQLANKAADRLAEASKRDPIKIMEAAQAAGQKRSDDLAKDFQRLHGSASDPLSFLRDPHVLNEAAAQRVVENDQLLEEAVNRFKDSSPAIATLRQKAMERLLAPVLRGGGGESLSGGIARMSDKAKDLLFPNGLAKQLEDIAKGVQTIEGSSVKAAPQLATGSLMGKSVPEYARASFIKETMAALVTHPRFVRMVAVMSSEMNRGGEPARRAYGRFMGIASALARPQNVTTPLGVASGRTENEGTELGREEIPDEDGDKSVQGWRGHAEGGPVNWRKHLQ